MKQEHATRIINVLDKTLKEYSLKIKPSINNIFLEVVDPENPYFSLGIFADNWNQKGKYSFHAYTIYKHRTNIKNDKGEEISSYYYHDFRYLLPEQEAKELGAVSEDYILTFNFDRNSKIDKKDTLIVSDFLRVLKPYLKLVNRITPILKKRIDKKLLDLENYNKLRTLGGLQPLGEIHQYPIKIKDYTITPRSSQTVEITRKVTLTEALYFARGLLKK